MLECLILGDSIAKGISDIRKECVAYVKSGINSQDYVKKYSGPFEARSVIISLGSNDYNNMTDKSLTALRGKIEPAQTVYWILPNIKETVRRTVWHIAKENNDVIIDARAYDRSPDTVHPTYQGYKQISNELRKKERE
jgi:lysophospholipase L1-like esterase